MQNPEKGLKTRLNGFAACFPIQPDTVTQSTPIEKAKPSIQHSTQANPAPDQQAKHLSTQGKAPSKRQANPAPNDRSKATGKANPAPSKAKQKTMGKASP